MKTKPFKHQALEFARHKDTAERAWWWSMRTGKSKAAVDLACHNYLKGRIDAVLVSAPNGVHEAWVADQLPAHMWDDVPYGAAAWSAKRSLRPGFDEEFKELLRLDGLAWFTFNMEALTVDARARKYIAKFVKARRILFVADESDDYGNPASQRTKAARALVKRTEMRRILTGTALEDGPLKAYSQFELLRPGALGFRSTGTVDGGDYVSGYSHFKDKYAEYEQTTGRGGSKYPKLVGYRELEDLKARMAPYTSVVLREEVDDMPELVRSRRYYEPSEKQMERYLDLYDNAVVELKSGRITVFEGGVRVLKMQQALSGFLISPEGDVEVFKGPNPRLDATAEEAQFALATRGKFIVWARFHEEIRMVCERLRKMGMTVAEYHGGVPKHKRPAQLAAFMEDPAFDGLVGQPAAGGRGLNMSAGKTIVWHSYGPRARDRLQANERATLVGGGSVDLVDVVAANWREDRVRQLIDSYILDDLDGKHALGEDLTRSGMQAYLEAMSRA
jgi:hypothetical protein